MSEQAKEKRKREREEEKIVRDRAVSEKKKRVFYLIKLYL